jgi:DNA-directed RNA polymerase specialized sigma24 family protein
MDMSVPAVSPVEHWKQHERLVMQIASKALTRAQAIDPTTSYEDLVSFFTEVYCTCVSRFDATKGAKFSTYMHTACFHEFNRWADKMERQRRVVSATSVQGMIEDEHGEVRSAFDFIASECDAPPEVLERRQVQKVMASRIAAMPPRFRQVIAILVHGPSPELLKKFAEHQEALRAQGHQAPTRLGIDFICKSLNFTPKEALALRNQIDRKFRVDIPSLNAAKFR